MEIEHFFDIMTFKQTTNKMTTGPRRVRVRVRLGYGKGATKGVRLVRLGLKNSTFYLSTFRLSTF